MMDCATIILGILHEDSPLNFEQIDDHVELADWLYEDIALPSSTSEDGVHHEGAGRVLDHREGEGGTAIMSAYRDDYDPFDCDAPDPAPPPDPAEQAKMIEGLQIDLTAAEDEIKRLRARVGKLEDIVLRVRNLDPTLFDPDDPVIAECEKGE